MNRQKKRSSRLRLSVAGALTVLALLATVSDAAVVGSTGAATAMTLQQAVSPLLNGVGPVPRVVVVPAKPAPRSPFQPPSWIPTVPTPPAPPTPPGRPTWVPSGPARMR